jgi:hypothetical protein
VIFLLLRRGATVGGGVVGSPKLIAVIGQLCREAKQIAYFGVLTA